MYVCVCLVHTCCDRCYHQIWMNEEGMRRSELFSLGGRFFLLGLLFFMRVKQVVCFKTLEKNGILMKKTPPSCPHPTQMNESLHPTCLACPHREKLMLLIPSIHQANALWPRANVPVPIHFFIDCGKRIIREGAKNVLLYIRKCVDEINLKVSQMYFYLTLNIHKHTLLKL